MIKPIILVLLLVVFSDSISQAQRRWRYGWTPAQRDSLNKVHEEKTYKNVLDRIEKYKSNTRKDTITTLRLGGARLTSIPDFVFEFINLKNLRKIELKEFLTPLERFLTL